MSTHLYLHLPFCHRRCHYCAFPVSTLHDLETQTRYVDKLLQDYTAALAQWECTNVDSIYIGGGTPTLVHQSQWERILTALQPHLHHTLEWTVETNPETTTPELLTLLKDAGVSRISMGVQSTSPTVLRALGRQHSPTDIHQGLSHIFDAGFTNVSIDLIIGLPGEETHTPLQSLHELSSYPLTHISGYMLMLKEGSAFATHPPQLPSEEHTTTMYYGVHEYLLQQGFQRYEVSNWSTPNYACTHNLGTWQHHPCIAIGMGAESYIDERRFSLPATLPSYLSTPYPTTSTLPKLSPTEWCIEHLLLGLRSSAGVALAPLHAHTPQLLALLEAPIVALVQEGLLHRNPTHLQATDKGILYLDHILHQLLTPLPL